MVYIDWWLIDFHRFALVCVLRLIDYFWSPLTGACTDQWAIKMNTSHRGWTPSYILNQFCLFPTLSVIHYRLPRKTDMERKIEIVQFAHRTRQLFVRLLSLVKWAKNGCKIDKCMVSIESRFQSRVLFIQSIEWSQFWYFVKFHTGVVIGIYWNLE